MEGNLVGGYMRLLLECCKIVEREDLVVRFGILFGNTGRISR